jgi:predicted NUDIX family NTP pyrophosphohydrolase
VIVAQRTGQVEGPSSRTGRSRWQTACVAVRRSAGILLFRRDDGTVEVLLGHLGGPFWQRRDAGAWSIPKGEHGDDEEPLAAAHREFEEELGLPVPSGLRVELGTLRATRGKLVTVWAVEGDLDPGEVVPGTFELEWPPRSGRLQSFPELDRVAWFGLEEAATRIVGGQRPFLDRLRDHLRDDAVGSDPRSSR